MNRPSVECRTVLAQVMLRREGDRLKVNRPKRDIDCKSIDRAANAIAWCSLREIPSAAEGGGFEPPVREPVRQFSKLLVSATHPSFLQDSGVRNLGVISLIAGAKVMLLFYSCKFFKDFFIAYCYFYRRSGRRDSNPRPSAWEANALPTEPLPQKKSQKNLTLIS